MDTVEVPSSEVELEPAPLITETSYKKNEEFFLFASVFDVNMIDKSLSDKALQFELSIGNAGNTLDGHFESIRRPQDMNRNLGTWAVELTSLLKTLRNSIDRISTSVVSFVTKTWLPQLSLTDT